MSHYCVLSFFGVDKVQEDSLSEFCFSFDAQGISESLEFQQTSVRYDPEVLEQEYKNLDVYFLQMPNENFFLNLKTAFPDLEYSISEEENKDWLEEWKKGYKAFEIVPKVWIVPSWLEAPSDAKIAIAIDPGLAFGTGTHATTQIASQWIYDLCSKHAPSSAIDVGCGTAILSILLEKLGVHSIVATEIEEMAREVGKRNLKLNESKNIRIEDFQIAEVKGSFDLVVANIIDGVLLDLKEDLLRCCALGGKILLTGILEDREVSFKKEFLADTDFKVIEKRKLNEWIGILLERN